MILAVTGIYGVIAQALSRRTQEMGLRMALGAAAWEVMTMAIRESMAPVWWGLGAGVALALILNRFLSTMLFGVAGSDARTFGAVALAMALAGVLAAYIPARKASSVDPAVALRHD
jgi:ABC-type antimicrobial peptide transport system permease subunit